MPDTFHELKSQLKTDFHFLKEATSKNIDHFQQALNLQQSYLAALRRDTNLIYSKLARIKAYLQKNFNYLDSNSDGVQLNALEYDSDIDTPQNTRPNPDKHTVVVSVQDIPTPPESITTDVPSTEEIPQGSD